MSTSSSLKLKRALQTDLLNSFSLHCSLMLCSSHEGDPLSPPEVEAACGDNHLTPFLSDFFIINLLMIIATGGFSGGGGRSTMCKEPPGSDCLLLSGILTEPPNHKKKPGGQHFARRMHVSCECHPNNKDDKKNVIPCLFIHPLKGIQILG